MRIGWVKESDNRIYMYVMSEYQFLIFNVVCPLLIEDEGEDVAAAIVLRPGASMTTDQLRAFLAERIAKYKAPATVWFRDEQLPRNASGKFLKRELRKELTGE